MNAPNEISSKIEHFVVLMMENRSFDHMLGHLSLEDPTRVDGLRPEMENWSDGQAVPVFELDEQVEIPDPDHSPGGVDLQLTDGNSGFAANYDARRPDAEACYVMGYYSAGEAPTYDFLAREFCISDRWFCSVRGETWPNRLYALTGGSAGRRENQRVPTYGLRAFTRELDRQEVSWRWYCHLDAAPATVVLADRSYAPEWFFDRRGNFALFDGALGGQPTFLEDAAAGNLPAMSWIDPRLLTPFGSTNDDHPPSPVRHGQELVASVYQALANSPQWERTLLLVTYDEHGGFFDHVGPGSAPDDRPEMEVFGVRVPALVVSPWVEAGAVTGSVDARVFDHTSIIATALRHFCLRPTEGWGYGRRVEEATDLGVALTRDTPRAAPELPPELRPPEDVERGTRDLVEVGSRYVFPTERPTQAAIVEGLAREMAAHGALEEERWLQERDFVPTEDAARGVTGLSSAPPELDEFQKGILRASLKLRAVANEVLAERGEHEAPA